MVASDNRIVNSSSFNSSNNPYSGVPLTKEDIVASRYHIKKFLHGEIIIEFTRDAGFLHQYYRIRDQEFKTSLQSDDYAKLEDEHDRNGHIVVARIGNFCIGGMRLNVKSPRRPFLLPVEIKEFRLTDYFPELKYKELTYGQVSGFAVLPELRSGEICRNLIQRACYKAKSLSVHLLFSAAPKANSRLYRMECMAMNMTNTKIHTEITLPEYNDTDYLVSAPLHEMPEDVSKSLSHHFLDI